MNQPQHSIRFITGSADDLLARAATGPMPITQFFTPEYYQLEKARVFKKAWLRVGFDKDIPKPGDYFVKELEVCDTSVLVVRGQDMQIRAFHNACSHRTNRVAYQESGHARAFTCAFHSWSYGLDGSLVRVPEEHLFPGLCKEQLGLTAVGCDTWEGFIFVNVDPDRTQTLREYLGEDFWNGFNGYFTRYNVVGRMSADIPCNWKICMDAFDENYHFNTVHMVSAGDIMLSKEYPNGRVDAVRLYPRHRMITVIGNNQYRPTFSEMLAFKYANMGAGLRTGQQASASGNPPQVNPLNVPDWLTDIVTVFPMCWMAPMPGFFLTQDYWPISHDQTRWELQVHLIAHDAAAAVAAERTWVFFRDAIREDLMNLKMIQTNLLSGAKATQQIGEMEVLVRHSYKALADAVGSGW